MTVRSGSAIGDFLRAVDALDGDGNASLRESFAELFGLALRENVSSPATPLPPPVPPTQPTQEIPETPALGSSPEQVYAGNPIPANARIVDTVDATSNDQRPDWLVSAATLPARSPRRIPAKMSLLNPRWIRAILTTALSTESDAGEVDIDRLVDVMVSGWPVQTLPRRQVSTMARGLYCWLDRSASMQLFIQDQGQLVSQLKDVAGSLGLSVRYTTGVPDRSQNMVAGVPHLVLSDLGFVEVPESFSWDPPEAWAEWSEWVNGKLDARVVALVPRPPSAYPAKVQAAFRLLHWDRGTSVQSAKRARA